MFASVVCDDLDCLVNDSLPSFEAESAQTLMEFDDFFNIDESEENESHAGISSLLSDESKKKKASKSRKSPILSKLYQPTNRITGLPYKGRAKSNSKVLRVFPVFDQSAALSNLPSTMAMLINSGNMNALSRLLYSHLDKNCKVNLNILSESSVTVRTMMMFLNFMTAVNPDMIMIVQTTKVDGLRIKASIYKKSTVNSLIYDVASKTVLDGAVLPMFGQTRADFFRRVLASGSNLNEGIAEIRDVYDTDQDLLMYARLEMELVVDDKTKLVSHLRVTHQVSSIEPVEQLSKYE